MESGITADDPKRVPRWPPVHRDEDPKGRPTAGGGRADLTRGAVRGRPLRQRKVGPHEPAHQTQGVREDIGRHLILTLAPISRGARGARYRIHMQNGPGPSQLGQRFDEPRLEEELVDRTEHSIRLLGEIEQPPRILARLSDGLLGQHVHTCP